MDNSKEWLRHINASGEPIIPSLQSSISTIMKKPEGYTLDELFDVNALAGKYRDLWHHVWVDNDLDVILAPPADHTAVLHDEYGFAHYTALWNLL
ncbi:hypothetical protein AC579_4064 [Pseudocercospora musae]|uniref:Amidase domain-containing protein n=1 Tax=Pseudocercospora musae TaxID=113226 RepID=A0A139I8V9_9PEZI|nr:hypothetical protein AC579_4064 [Pseudocercospora musae]